MGDGGKPRKNPKPRGNYQERRTSETTITHNDKAYRQRNNLTSILLLGISIGFCIAMNLDGISRLNDMAGGITVTLVDDFSALDPAMVQGATLTLQGNQAEIYVRSRINVVVGANEVRMVRQKRYFTRLFA